MVAASIEYLVRQRAGERCEYCHMPQAAHVQSFHIDHILANQHIIDDGMENLALACFRCNGFKGTNVAGVDPLTRKLVRLFHPRLDRWDEHFRQEDGLILGTTAIGRITVHVLNMNEWSAVRLRKALIQRNRF